MAKVCAVTGKKPITGNKVSHANNKARRRWEPNLKVKRIWVPGEGKFISLKVSAKGLKTIDKKGIDAVLRDMKKKAKKG